MAPCSGCIHFNPEGWAYFRGPGGPIRQGRCAMWHFYTIDAARWACQGSERKEAVE